MTAKKTNAKAMANKLLVENPRVENKRLKEALAGQTWKHEIATLKEELRGAVEEVDKYRDLYLDSQGRMDRAVRRIKELKTALKSTWDHNDVLCAQLVGSQEMPDGRLVREYARDITIFGKECADTTLATD